MATPHPIPTCEPDKILLVLNALERLPELSQQLQRDAETGEPYETLARRIDVLNANITELANLAGEAKYCALSEA